MQIPFLYTGNSYHSAFAETTVVDKFCSILAKAIGKVMAVFEQTFIQLKQAITFFLQQPLNKLSTDELQKFLNAVKQYFFRSIFQ